jgi:hypothetical protein
LADLLARQAVRNARTCAVCLEAARAAWLSRQPAEWSEVGIQAQRAQEWAQQVETASAKAMTILMQSETAWAQCDRLLAKYGF